MAHDLQLKLHEGCVYKRGKLNKGWKERWFVLWNDLKLKYYESQCTASESEMLGNDKNVYGVIDLLNVELIEVALIDKSVESTIPKYVKILSNYKKTSANKSGKNNENGSIDNKRSYIIHLILSSRTYILSANTLSDFNKWLTIFYKYIYDGIIYESYIYKQGKQNKSFKRRYFCLNQYKQIKYYNNDKREVLHGFIDLNDIHSFNIENIENNYAPNPNLIQLNGQKRIWIICCDTKEILTVWCQELEKLKLKTAKKIGGSFYKQNTTFFPVDDDEKRTQQQFRSIRGDTITENINKTSVKSNKFQITVQKTEKSKESLQEETKQKEEDNEGDEGDEGDGNVTYSTYSTPMGSTPNGNNHNNNDYPIQFKVIVDGIGLYQDIELEQEVFGLDGFEKGTLMNGKYAMDKIVQLENELFCSMMAVEEIGYAIEENTQYMATSGTTNNSKNASLTVTNTKVGVDEPDFQKLPSYFNI